MDCPKLLVYIAISLVLSASHKADAARSLSPEGTTWATEGTLQVKGQGRKEETEQALKVFFGLQTATTDSGQVELASGEFLLVLPRSGEDALLSGSYTASKKGKPKKFTPLSGSVEKFVRALVERALGGAYEGELDLKKFKVKLKPRVKKGQEIIDIKVRVKVKLDGAVGGEEVAGKWRLKYRGSDNRTTDLAETKGSECLIGGSAVASGCVVTTQQPVLQIPGMGTGNVYITDGNATDQNNAWVSDEITLSPGGECGENTCFTVPPDAGLLPRHSYQWTFIPNGGGDDLVWRGFTIDYVRAGREPTDSLGPLTMGLASQTVQTSVQTQAVQTASGTVQIGLVHRGAFTGTPTGEPWFAEDPAGSLPAGWVFSGVDANVPWVRIEAVDAVGGSGTRAVTLQAFDGSLLEYTNTGGGSGGWAPPVAAGRPANDYGSLSQSTDGSTFTWTSGTSVVTFVQSSEDATVWLASSSQVVLPGAGDLPSPGLELSWHTSGDLAGRLKTIADQSSLDGSGNATRNAQFFYGGETECGSPNESGLVAAPSGMLCAFENLDGTTAQVFYVAQSTSFGSHQIGRVALPGGAQWTFEWQVGSYGLTDNTTVTASQLVSVQTPTGNDAAKAGTVGADDSKWWVVYDTANPFFQNLPVGFVSPLPGTGPGAGDRLGRHYTLATGANPGQAQIAWASVTGSSGSFSLSPGAVLEVVSFDSAWRLTSTETFLSEAISYTTDLSWDTGSDRQTGVSFAGASQTQEYDFLGRPSTLAGPGTASGMATYDQGNLAGWIATVYDNDTLTAPGASSEVVNSAGIDWQSNPDGATGGAWSLVLSTYLAAPAGGGNVAYRVRSDGNGSATLWVNGKCDAASESGTCNGDNSATTSTTTATGDALNLVVQYVRGGTAASSTEPVTVAVEQQVDGGDWTALNLVDLDPGLDLQSTVSATDTLSVGGSAVTLTQTASWQEPLFGTLSKVSYPGLDGDLVTTPGYESNYDPNNSQWKRLTSQKSAGGSNYGFGYWENTATPQDPACDNTDGVIQAGQVRTLTYPDADTGAATGLSRGFSYDSAGRRAGLEVIPAGESSGVSGCLSYDARGRRIEGRVSAYTDSSSSTGGGAMSKAWAYSADSLTVTITHTFEDPPKAPACASESTPPYTCTETRTVDLLGRTVENTDVWGAKIAVDYKLDPSSGVQTVAATTTAGTFTTTTTLKNNRDGTPASQSRTDSAGSPTLETTWTYGKFGRTQTVGTQSGGAEVITATYGYDDQNRVDSRAWSRAGTTVTTNELILSPNSSRTLGETIEVGGVKYTFDYTFNNAGWLTEAQLTSTDSNLTANWKYDFGPSSLGSNGNARLNGNVTTATNTIGQNSESLELGYDFLDRVEATSSNDTLEHDSLGNLTQFGNLELTYEQTNQLIEAKDGATTVAFDRLPDGDLYRKTTTNGSDTTIRYALNGLILDESGNATSQTVAIGPLLANFDLTTPSASDYTVITLQYGNALLRLDSTGAPQNLDKPTLYSPWGEAINAPASDPARPLYGWQAANLLETNLGLVQMGERTYLTGLGRFTTLDPLFGGGINGYNYGNNDPINNNDPNGKSSLIDPSSFTRDEQIAFYGTISVGSGLVTGIVSGTLIRLARSQNPNGNNVVEPPGSNVVEPSVSSTESSNDNAASFGDHLSDQRLLMDEVDNPTPNEDVSFSQTDIDAVQTIEEVAEESLSESLESLEAL